MSYWRFAAMIATSTVVMFGLMYLNTYLVGHVFFSETRAYMAVLMGATMAVIMLAFMLTMYANQPLNAAIFGGAIVAFALSLWLVRSQVTVGDLSYMRAMIPHHSIAIMTSNRANISDPRVRKLADGIVYAQNKEIAEMRYLANDIAQRGDAPDDASQSPPALVTLGEAISTPVVGLLDAEPLTTADLAQLFPDGIACSFTFTTDSPPVLAVGDVEGTNRALVKISDDLVALDANGPGQFGADGIEIRVDDPAGAAVAEAPGTSTEADMTLNLDAGLTVGYNGRFQCAT